MAFILHGYVGRDRAAIEQRIYRIDGTETLLVGIPDVSVEQRRVAPVTSEARIAPSQAAITMPVPVTLPMPIEIRESYLAIREVASQAVITAVELLSPSNKRTRQGREIYEEKRFKVLASRTHLIEIDLLRGGEPMTVWPAYEDFDYRILVSRSDQRPRVDLHGFKVTETIPTFPLPLGAGDVEPMVDLHELLDQVYDRGGYTVVIDYHLAPSPPLPMELADWPETVLKDHGLR